MGNANGGASQRELVNFSKHIDLELEQIFLLVSLLLPLHNNLHGIKMECRSEEMWEELQPPMAQLPAARYQKREHIRGRGGAHHQTPQAPWKQDIPTPQNFLPIAVRFNHQSCSCS